MSDRESGDEQHPAQSMFTNYYLTIFSFLKYIPFIKETYIYSLKAFDRYWNFVWYLEIIWRVPFKQTWRGRQLFMYF